MACGTSVARPAGLGYFSPVFVAGRHRGLGVGLLLAGMIALSACGGSGSAPRALPALSTTPAADASTAPPTSRAAELAAASAVVKRYFAVLNGLAENMDAAPFAAIEAPTCACREFVRSVRDVAARNETYFGTARIRGLTPAIDSPELVEVLVTYDASVGGTKDAAGRVVTSSAARNGVTAMFYVVRTGQRWYISKISVISRGKTR
jgi:hypothetical protein